MAQNHFFSAVGQWLEARDYVDGCAYAKIVPSWGAAVLRPYE